jgi:Fur family ferric uptake transcriptional regulator
VTATVPVAERLRAAGERVTPQRLRIADALTAAGRQLTADEVWAAAGHDRGIGRATVFRSLDALVAAGVARRLELEGHSSAYVSCQPEHHHHLSCRECGRVEEIGESFVRPMIERLAAERGFEVDDARLDFYGRCAACAERAG